jgi:hypothetical protein
LKVDIKRRDRNREVFVIYCNILGLMRSVTPRRMLCGGMLGVGLTARKSRDRHALDFRNYRRRRHEDLPIGKQMLASQMHTVTIAPLKKVCAGNCAFRRVSVVISMWKGVTKYNDHLRYRQIGDLLCGEMTDIKILESNESTPRECL